MTIGTARLSISGCGVTYFTWGVYMKGGAVVAQGLHVAGGLETDTITASQTASVYSMQITGVDDGSNTGACGASNLGLMRMFRTYEDVRERATTRTSLIFVNCISLCLRTIGVHRFTLFLQPRDNNGEM